MRLVNIKQAFKLSGIGFNYPCMFRAYPDPTPYIVYTETKGSIIDINNIKYFSNNPEDRRETAIPDYGVVFKWFRDQGYLISVICNLDYYTYSIYIRSENMKVSDSIQFKFYEELEDFLIDKLIDLYEEVNQKSKLILNELNLISKILNSDTSMKGKAELLNSVMNNLNFIESI